MTYLYRLSVFVVGVFVTSPVPMYADGCRVVRTSYAYQTPTYNYVAPYQPVVAIPVVAQTFYQVAPDLAQTRVNQVMIQDAAKAGAKEALNELRDAERKSAPSPRPNGDGVKPTNPIPESVDPLEQFPITTGDGKTYGTVGGGSRVQAIFNQSCLKCHGTGEKTDLSNASLLSKVARKKVLASVRHDEDVKAMPPKAKLGLAEIRLVESWVYEENGN